MNDLRRHILKGGLAAGSTTGAWPDFACSSGVAVDERPVSGIGP